MNKRSILTVILFTCLSSAATIAQAGAAAEHLAGAIRFPTVSHQDPAMLDEAAFLGLHNYLRSNYPRVFSELQVEVINNYSLLMVWPGTDDSRPPVLFTAHMDVVPVEPGTESGWTHPAFAGVIDKGMIYGRGSLDDKVGVISWLEAAERLLTEGFVPRRTLVFGFGHDEEIGGDAGAAMIAARLRELGMHFEWMVDEGSVILENNPMTPGRPTALIGVAEKAYLTLSLTATGQGGHSSMPPAHTAAGKLAAAVVQVENNPLPIKLVAPIDTMLERSAAHVDFPNNLVLDNLWLTGSLVANRMAQERATNSLVRTTTAVTILRAGVKDNVIPQTAEARVNFRLLPGDTPAMVIEHIRRAIDNPEIGIEVGDTWQLAPPMAAMDGSGFEVIGEAARSRYPEAVVLPFLLAGATDIRHYVDLADNHYRFHGITIGVEQTGGIHGTDERLGVESFEAAVDIAAQMMRGAQ